MNRRRALAPAQLAQRPRTSRRRARRALPAAVAPGAPGAGGRWAAPAAAGRRPAARASSASCASSALAREPVPLPDGEVGVLHRQLGQGRRPPREKAAVERRDLAHQHAHGPAVADDVVHGEAASAVLLRARRSSRARSSGPAAEVEGAPPLLRDPAQRLRAPRAPSGQPGEVHERDGDRRRRGGPPAPASPAHRSTKHGAQRLVAAHHLRQAAAQRRHVQRAAQPQRGRACCRRCSPGRAGRGTRAAAGRRRAATGPSARAAGDARGRGPRRRQGGLHPRRRAPPRWAPRTARAAAARRRAPRAGARPPAWPAASARPARRSSSSTPTRSDAAAPPPRSRPATSSDGRPRRHVRSAAGPPRPAPAGRAVHLAVGGQRQALEGHEGGGHHVLRQPARDRRARSSAADGSAALLRDHVGHQALLPRPVLAHHDGRLAHPGVRQQHGLDLPRLDAEAADLDLVVGPAQELQLPVRAPPHQVAGPVEPCARLARRTGRGRSAPPSAPAGPGSRAPARRRRRTARPPPPRAPARPTRPARRRACSPSAGRSAALPSPPARRRAPSCRRSSPSGRTC